MSPGEAVAHDMREAVNALCVRYVERIEYKVGNPLGVLETRRAVRVFPGLLRQLEDQASMPMSFVSQGPGSPNKSGSKPPGNPQFIDLIDAIHEQTFIAWATLGMEDIKVTRQPLHHSLTALADVVSTEADTYDAQTVCIMAQGWVTRCKVMLGYETRVVMLADRVCGTCSGGLAVAMDASTDVRCMGTPATPPCGATYPRLTWIDLLP